jgi:hypothetical protein
MIGTLLVFGDTITGTATKRRENRLLRQRSRQWRPHHSSDTAGANAATPPPLVPRRSCMGSVVHGFSLR